MGGRPRRVPGCARRAADVARKRVDVRSRHRRRTSDARRHAALDGPGKPRSIDCAGQRTSASSRPRRPRQETMNHRVRSSMKPSHTTEMSVGASERQPLTLYALRALRSSRSTLPTLLTLHVLLTIFAALGLASCKKGGADAKPADVAYYTCTMHPSVKKQNPTDKCPICSMDLLPVKKKDAGGSASASDVDYYICTMHPSVKKHRPTDKCPVCSMDLVPVKKQGASDRSGHAAHAGHTSMSDTV